MPVRESSLTKQVMAAAGHCGATLFRNNVGKFRDSRGVWVAFGVGGVGGPDFVGFSRTGQFIAAELKPPEWKPRSAKEKERHAKQLSFLASVRASGGIAGVVYGYSSVVELIKGQDVRLPEA